MMKARKATLFLAMLFLPLAFVAPAVGLQGDGIIVNDADEVRGTSVNISRDLVDTIAGVGPRVVLQYANQLRHAGLVTVPGPLQELLEQVSDRIIVQYANTICQDGLPALPSGLQALLEQVSDRIVFQYANANRSFQLVYPVALFNDTAAPRISDITASMTGCDSLIIAWTTDEFADSEVVYGGRSGQYTQTVSDPLYAKYHELVLTGLMQGTYYYRVRSTDRSGNTATSSERSFTLACIYMPVVVRSN